jgi:stage II sporulation protein D
LANGKAYPGILTLVGRSEGATFDVINRVPLEDYLRGVVAAEMFSGWPLASYQAQAVTARSYALSERARSRAVGAPFDVEAGTRDQAYGGASDNPIVARAVSDTRGVVLTWNGDVLRAYYSSTCGGRPAAARDTWPTGPGMTYNLAGPLQGQPRDHACQAASYYRWTVTRPRAELTSRFKAFGREAGLPIKALTSIESIRPAGVNASGRPNRFLVVQPGGQSYTLTGEELRRAANQEGPGLPPVTAANRVHGSDVEIVVGGTTATFTGRGFGHGVGLCQWCAKGFADRGEAWTAILARFYPGARTEKVY